MPFLAILKNWKLAIVGAAVLALVVGWFMLKAAWADRDLAEQKEKAALQALNQVMETNAQNLAEMARWQAEAERASQVALDAEALSEKRATQLRAIRAEIVADEGESCPVAPVMVRALDGLRHLRGPAADRHEDPGGADTPAADPAELPR